MIRKKFNEEYKRVVKFQKTFFGARIDTSENNFNPRQYLIHVLAEGTTEEKRELLGSLKSKLFLKNKAITVEKNISVEITQKNT